MNTTSNLKKPVQKFTKRFAAGTFGLSLLIHGSVLFLVGGVVLVQGVVPRADFLEVPLVENTIVEDTPPEIPEEPEQVPATESADSSSMPAGETPDSNPWIETAVVATMQPSLQMAPLDGAKSMAGTSSLMSGTQAGTDGQGKGGIRNMGSFFGSKGGGSNALTGYLYDLKQTREKKPSDMATVAGEVAEGSTKENVRCHEVIGEFIKRWDEGILEKYFRTRNPLSTYQFFIPSIEADAAPKAFDVERDVKPRRWMVHYKGEVTAEKGGHFRFVGLGDDVLIVRFQKKMVFDGSWTPFDPEVNSKETYTFLPGVNQKMRTGSWFRINAGETCSFEILIGEVPGGKFSSCLLIEEKDRDYKKRADGGGPVLPVFQTAPTRVPSYKKDAFPEVAEEPFVLGK